jgi:hypothetical protein
MFSRLASLNEGFDNDTNIKINNLYDTQALFYKNVLGVIPSDNQIPPPPDMQAAVSSLNPTNDPPDVNMMFEQSYVTNANMLARNTPCTQAQSIDDVIDNASTAGCGWFYTPPAAGTIAPKFNKGWLSTSAGPVGLPGAPTRDNYSKFYYDGNGGAQDGTLEQGKKQILKDMCLTATSCSEIGSAIYNGQCGWCPEGMAVPINANGTLKYPSQNVACNNVITSAAQCPAPPPTVVNDPNACVGPFSRACLSTVLTGLKCDTGTLNAALTGSFNPNNVNINTAALSQLPAMTQFNNKANTPFNISRFLGASPGALRQDSIAEVMKIANASTSMPRNSATGSAARDLCVTPGAMGEYNFCDDLTTQPSGGWPLTCLQYAFRKAGGTQQGTGYPRTTTQTGQQAITNYNTMTNWTDVNNSMAKTYSIARGVLTEGFTTTHTQGYLDYGKNVVDTNAQSNALMTMIGVTAAKLGTRVPYVPGVEVFWKNGYRIVGYSVEQQIPIINGSSGYSSIFPNIVSNSFIGLSDMRTTTNVPAAVICESIVIPSNNFGFWGSKTSKNNVNNTKTGVALNGPLVNLDQHNKYAAQRSLATYMFTASPNVFQVQWQSSDYSNDSTMIQSNTHQVWKLTVTAPLKPSITREATGPFIMLEMMIYNNTNTFCDLRLPNVLEGLYQPKQFSNSTQALGAPGKNGYMTLANKNYYSLFNVMMNCIAQMTFVFRVNSVGLADNYLFNFACVDDGNNATTMYGSIARNGNQPILTIIRDINQTKTTVGTIPVNINEWTMGVFTNNGSSWSISLYPINRAIATSDDWTKYGYTTVIVPNPSGNSFVSSHPESHGMIAGISPTILNFNHFISDANFSMDVAWIHMFNKKLTGPDIQRDAKNDWLFTKAQ